MCAKHIGAINTGNCVKVVVKSIPSKTCQPSVSLVPVQGFQPLYALTIFVVTDVKLCAMKQVSTHCSRVPEFELIEEQSSCESRGENEP